jgi:uroporphyrinogen III methyltransferase/synthase
MAVIGPVTAEAIKKAGLKVDIMPKQATIEALVDEIIKWVEEQRRRTKEENAGDT